MTIQPGDPNGIAEHNDLTALVAQVAALQGVTVDLPPVAVLGQPGHVDAHNKLRAAIDAVATQGGMTWAAATGGTESTITVNGKQMKVHTFIGNGTLAVSRAGYMEVLLVSGGSGNSGSSGNAGDVVRGIHQIPAGSHAVTVGPGADGTNGTGRQSKIGAVLATSVARPALTTDGTVGAGGNDTDYQLGLASDITGPVVTYATANGPNVPNSGNGRVGNNGCSGIVIVRYQI